jgi:hypothetical protein
MFAAIRTLLWSPQQSGQATYTLLDPVISRTDGAHARINIGGVHGCNFELFKVNGGVYAVWRELVDLVRTWSDAELKLEHVAEIPFWVLVTDENGVKVATSALMYDGESKSFETNCEVVVRAEEEEEQSITRSETMLRDALIDAVTYLVAESGTSIGRAFSAMNAVELTITRPMAKLAVNTPFTYTFPIDIR